MQDNFKQLGISQEILNAIKEMGFTDPTQVQIQAIPIILDKKDVIVMSKTGSGKTAVFGIPMLDLISSGSKNPQGLILTPTRELSVQVENDLKLISKYLPHKITSVYGQHSINTEIQVLKKGVDIISGTPGRVYDHLENRNFNPDEIKFLVLDEADRMLDMGFLPQVVRIIKSLPKDRLTLLFSATIPNEVKRISREFMNSPEIIEISSETMTVDTVSQYYYRVIRKEKNGKLLDLLHSEKPENCMIFCNTKIATDRVSIFLNRKGFSCFPLHGDIPQSKRMSTIERFKSGDFNILVATDVAARGIHIDTLSLVINYDIPSEKDSYVHRIGRTGRAGNKGLAISLVTDDEIMSLYAIEEHIGAMIEEKEFQFSGRFEEKDEKFKTPIKPKQKFTSTNTPVKSRNRVSDNNPKAKSGEKFSDRSFSSKTNSKITDNSDFNKSETPVSSPKFKLRTTTAPGRSFPKSKISDIPDKTQKNYKNEVSNKANGKVETNSLIRRLINKIFK